MTNCRLLWVLFSLGLLCPVAYPLQVGSDTLSRMTVPHLPQWTESLPDLGPVERSKVLQHLSLVVERSPERETSFQSLLHEQYEQGSPNYHHWLTPDELGKTYGVSDEILDDLTNWLKSQGLQVESISNNRIIIYFNGTIESLSAAFSTNFHYFDLNGNRVIAFDQNRRFRPSFNLRFGLSRVSRRYDYGLQVGW